MKPQSVRNLEDWDISHLTDGHLLMVTSHTSMKFALPANACVWRGGKRTHCGGVWRCWQKGKQNYTVCFEKRHGQRTVAGWQGSVFMREWTSLTGREQNGGRARSEAGGVIVSSSLASAANCLDECRAMAASHQMNRKQCLGERAGSVSSYVHVRIRVRGKDNLWARGRAGPCLCHYICSAQVNSHSDHLRHHHYPFLSSLPQDHQCLIQCYHFH